MSVSSGWRVGGQHLAVHLVRRDVQEALEPRALARGFEQRVGAEDVGLDERPRLHQRAVDVSLRREVHDVVGLRHQLTDERSVADVAVHEAIAGVVLDVAEVVGIAGVGELVEVDDAGVGVLAEEAEDEVAADEAAAAGDEVGASQSGISMRLWSPRVRL